MQALTQNVFRETGIAIYKDKINEILKTTERCVYRWRCDLTQAFRRVFVRVFMCVCVCIFVHVFENRVLHCPLSCRVFFIINLCQRNI